MKSWHAFSAMIHIPQFDAFVAANARVWMPSAPANCLHRKAVRPPRPPAGARSHPEWMARLNDAPMAPSLRRERGRRDDGTGAGGWLASPKTGARQCARANEYGATDERGCQDRDVKTASEVHDPEDRADEAGSSRTESEIVIRSDVRLRFPSYRVSCACPDLSNRNDSGSPSSFPHCAIHSIVVLA
jgi:hypothetical protein